MNEERILKYVLSIKVKREGPRECISSRWEQQVRRDITQEEEHENKFRRNCGKSE
jgi:hypothetical protein